jgi:hypothetical protein
LILFADCFKTTSVALFLFPLRVLVFLYLLGCTPIFILISAFIPEKHFIMFGESAFSLG